MPTVIEVLTMTSNPNLLQIAKKRKIEGTNAFILPHPEDSPGIIRPKNKEDRGCRLGNLQALMPELRRPAEDSLGTNSPTVPLSTIPVKNRLSNRALQ